jgi:hypothetical protein
MKRPEERYFAVIENGIVVNVIVGVEDEVVEANQEKYIEYTDENPARIGYTYDGTNFIAPVIEETE